MATIASLVVDLTANTAKFQRNMKAAMGPVEQFRIQVERATKSIDDFARQAKKTAAIAGAAFTGLAAVGAKFVNLASEAQQLNNVINQSFGEMAAAVNDWAEKTGNILGRSTHTMRSYAGYMQALIKPIVGVNDIAAEMSMTLAELAVDLAAFYDREDDEAFTALRSALMGEIEPMKKFGVAMTQAELQAFALSQGINKKISAMTEAEKVMLRYRYLIDRTRIAQGTALREANEYANTTKALKEEFREQAESIGHILMPAYAYVVDKTRELIRWFGSLDNATKTQITQWGLIGVSVLGFVSVLATAGSAVAVFIKGLMLLGSVIGFITSPMVLAITLIALAVAALYTAWEQNWGGIQDKTQKVWEAIKPIVDKVSEWLNTAWQWAINLAGNAWKWLKETTWSEKIADIKSWLTAGWEWLINIAGTAWDWLTKTTWAEKISDIKGWLSTAWDWVINLGGSAWVWIDRNLPWLADTMRWIWDKLQSAWEWSISKAGDAWDKLGDSAFAKWIDEVKAKITDSKAWKWTIDVALPAVIEGGKAVINAVVELGGEVYDAIKKGFKDGDWGPLFGIASDIWSTGALIKLGLELAGHELDKIKQAIIKAFGLSGGINSVVGTGIVIGVMTIGIQLAEAWAKKDYDNFVRNVIAAGIAGVFGGMIGGPAGAIVTFDIVLNLKLGETIYDEIENIIGYIKYMFEEGVSLWDMIRGRYPDDMMGFGEWLEKQKGIVDEPLPPPERAVNPIWDIPESELSKYVQIYPVRTPVEDIIDTTKPLLNITESERQMLAALAQLEAGIDGIEGMAAVVEVVFNRMEQNAKLYGSTVEEVIRKANQFEPVMTGKFDELLTSGKIAAEALEAVDLALRRLAEGAGVTRGATYFANLDIVRKRNPNHWMLDPTKMIPTVTIGGHTFGIAGYAEGTPWTGWGALDEVAGIVHKREAVIPWRVLKKGPLAVLEFLGMPGFQSGRVPESVPGLSSAQASITNMQSMFNSIGKTILSGLSKLFEILSHAIETIALALVGEEKVAEIKEVFASMRTALDDFEKSLTETTETNTDTTAEQLTMWQKLKAGLQSLMDKLNATAYAQQFYESVLNKLNPIANLFSALLNQITPALNALMVPIILLTQIFGTVLTPVLRALFPVFKTLGLIVAEVVLVFVEAWNTLAKLVKYATLGFVDMVVVTTDIRNAIDTLKSMTWESALKFDELNKEISEATRNVPQGLKLVSNRIAAADNIPSVQSIQPQERQGDQIEINIEGNVFGINDLKKIILEAVAEAQRRSALASNGVSG